MGPHHPTAEVLAWVTNTTITTDRRTMTVRTAMEATGHHTRGCAVERRMRMYMTRATCGMRITMIGTEVECSAEVEEGDV